MSEQRVPGRRPVLLVHNCSETFTQTQQTEQSVGDVKDKTSVLALLFHCGKHSYFFLTLEIQVLSLSVPLPLSIF